VVKPELGTKRACPSCHSRFYDLRRDPIVCPKCGVSFTAEAVLPSKAEHAAPKPQPVAQAVPAETEDVELVSLEEIKEVEGEEDETAGIEDVEIEEEAEVGAEDTFLEEEEEGAEPGVGNLIGGGKGEDEEA
jgi:uncharacterized protein (TIGR02300 family)